MFHLLLAIIYLAFISLGLPDGLLGSAWPSMYQEFQVPVSYAGIISMIIAAGTIVSSLQSDRLTPAPGARTGDSHQRGHDSGRPLRLLLQPLLHPSVPVGHSLRPGSRQRGRRPQQLCGSPLHQHAHELAPLHVGRGRLRRPLHHGPCPLRRRPLEHRLPVRRHPPGRRSRPSCSSACPSGRTGSSISGAEAVQKASRRTCPGGLRTRRPRGRRKSPCP